MIKNNYGVLETNPLSVPHSEGDWAPHTVNWTSKELKKITRLRLLSNPGYPLWDVSYCHGILKDGRRCNVSLPFSELPKDKIFKTIIKLARKDKVYAKGLGILDSISKLS